MERRLARGRAGGLVRGGLAVRNANRALCKRTVREKNCRCALHGSAGLGYVETIALMMPIVKITLSVAVFVLAVLRFHQYETS
jgi:hypothetical protein